jgi:hypothetical protein
MGRLSHGCEGTTLCEVVQCRSRSWSDLSVATLSRVCNTVEYLELLHCSEGSGTEVSSNQPTGVDGGVVDEDGLEESDVR